VVTGSREGGVVKGALLKVKMVLAIVKEYISRSYSRSSRVIWVTPILDIASKPVLCPLSGIHKSHVLIEYVSLLSKIIERIHTMAILI